MKGKQRILSLLLCGAMLFSICPQPALAAENGQAGNAASGLCEHHPQHTADCGYTEEVAETPCGHAHTEDCYEAVTNCVHVHDEGCYPTQAAPSDTENREPSACTHVCSEESGCITKELHCQYTYDSACGYTEGSEGTPCTFVCEICNPQDSGDAGQKPDGGTQAQCTCTTLCTEGNANSDCPVCGAEGAERAPRRRKKANVPAPSFTRRMQSTPTVRCAAQRVRTLRYVQERFPLPMRKPSLWKAYKP